MDSLRTPLRQAAIVLGAVLLTLTAPAQQPGTLPAAPPAANASYVPSVSPMRGTTPNCADPDATCPAPTAVGTQGPDGAFEDDFGTRPSDCAICIANTLAGLPPRASCQFSQWDSAQQPFIPTLSLPKFVPPLPASQCARLIQAEFRVRGTLCGLLRVENRDPLNGCEEILTLGSIIQLDKPICSGTGVVVPGFPDLPTIDLSQIAGPFTLGKFDGNVDFMGWDLVPQGSGRTIEFPPMPMEQCLRITDPAILAELTDADGDGIVDQLVFDHRATDSSSAAGCAPVTFLSDPFAGVEVDVRYVYCTNQKPVCQPESARVCAGGSVDIDVLANDSDPENELDCASLTITTAPANGMAVVNNCTGSGAACPGCVVTYTPNPGYVGPDSFAYTISDTGDPADPDPQDPFVCTSAPCVVNIDVCETIAVDDDVLTCRNQAVTFDVSVNDSTSCGLLDCSSVTIVTPPASGMLTVNGCNITYTPGMNFQGPDAFTYRISNDQTPACSDEGSVSINVCRTLARPNLDVPVCKDASTTIDVLANDETTCGSIDPTSVMITIPPGNGMATVNPNGTITYTPNPGFVGADGFQYKVASDAPPFCMDTANVSVDVCDTVAVNDSIRTCVDAAVPINVVANDSTTCGALDLTSLMVAMAPANGTATVNPGGMITYTPNAGFFGSDSFTYTICNDLTPACCDTGTVTIEVCAATAPDVTSAVCTGGSVQIPLPGSTSCGTASCSITVRPSNGMATLNGCTVTYTPAPGFIGTDTLTYRVASNQRPFCEDFGTVTIEVCQTIAVDDTPARICDGQAISIPVTSNDSTSCGTIDCTSITIVAAPAGGTAVRNGCNVLYTPNPGFSGADSFTYSVCNSGGSVVCCDTATVFLEVCSTTAVDDSARTCAGDQVCVSVLGNDTTTCGTIDPASLTIVTQPGTGTASVVNGQICYTPPAGFTGSVAIVYRVGNTGTPACLDTATLTVEVCDTVAVDDGPVSLCVGGMVTIPVTVNDTTSCGTILCSTLMVVTPPANGTAVVNGCSIVYTANPGFVGGDSFTYKVGNNTRPSCEDTATVTLEVCQTIAVDDTPPRICDGQPLSIPVTSNDSTSCGTIDCTSITIVTPPIGGTAVRNGCSVLYTPNPGFSGADSFTYSVCNTGGNVVCCDTATVFLEVCSTTAVDDSARTCAGDQVCFSVLANDSTTCGTINPATLAIVAQPGTGTASVVNGQICYTPPAGFSGSVVIPYQVGNTGTPSCIDTATLTVEVCQTVAVDDGPVNVCTGDMVTIPVTVNDTTTCGKILCSTLMVVTPPANGTAVVSGCSIVYTSNPGFTGPDSFTYKVGNNSRPRCEDTATVSVFVCSTTAFDDRDNRVCVGDSILIPVTLNDTTTCGPLDCTSLTVTSAPASGTATVEGCSIRFTPSGNATGQVCFEYSVANQLGCSDTATVCVDVCRVIARNDGRLRVCSGEELSIPVTVNDDAECGTLDCNSITIVTAPTSGTAVRNGCNIVYTAPADFSGTITFEYQICDNQTPPCCDTAIVTVEVCDVNAVDDTATTCAGDAIQIPVHGNDTTTCGALDCNSIVITSPPANGTAVPNGCGVTYTPPAGFTGDVTFEYEICNDSTPVCCDRATVTVTVCETIALNDQVETCPGQPVTIPVTSNDSTTCGLIDCTSITIVSGPTNGSAVRQGCGIRYTPNGGFVGTDTFQYRVCNDQVPACCDVATVTITVNPAPDAMDDLATLPPTGTDSIDIDVLDNDLPGAPCVLVPSSVTIVQQPTRGTITGINLATGEVTYKPNDDFLSGADVFCYSVMNSCGCIDTACVTVVRPEDLCPMRNRRQPGSLTIFTEFDNRSSNQTLITITNTNCDQMNGSVYVHLFYVNKDNCLKSDFTIHLTPCDTWTAVTSAHNPNFQRGYIFAYAMNAQGKAISFNHLIANQIVLDGINSFDYGLNAVMFKAVSKVRGTLTDEDGDGQPDLDGVEYEEAPDRILIPRYLGQDERFGGPNQSELVLINLSGGQSFTTIVDLMIFNDNEEGFSAQKSFYCWERYRLAEVSGSFLEGFLKGTNHDPNEVIGDPATEAGWFWVDGRVANSTVETIIDPAIYAVLIERSIPHSVADLPWEECIQDNGDLCVFGPFGDGPNPVIGDNQ